MKVIAILIILVSCLSLTTSKIKRTILRSSFKAMACTLTSKYQKLTKLDSEYITLKQNSILSNLKRNSSEYIQFINQLKQLNDLGKQYLAFKMLYGDIEASKIFMDLKEHQKNKVINEIEIFENIKRVIDTTDGIGAQNYAKYTAIEYLKNSSPYVCKHINEPSFIERKSIPTINGWESIKYFKHPLNANISSEQWNDPEDTFPMIVQYAKKNNTCKFKDPDKIEYVNDISSVILKKNCHIQIISNKTKDTREIEKIPINLNNSSKSSKNISNVSFYVNENKLDYNCMGWSIGVQDYLNPNLFNKDDDDIKSKDELIIYLMQFREAFIYVEKNRNKKDIYNRILKKKKPEPSLLNDIIKSNEPKKFIQNHLVGIKGYINQKTINKFCKGDLDNAVIFYGQDGIMTHSARFVKNLNTWTSKLGLSYLISHSLNSLSDSKNEGSVYGSPRFIYCPSGVNEEEIEGMDRQKNDFN